ncbi:uncharacterized protein METZ01_LOCUS237110 [marine metagenome]|uniref:Uncharacterized protein n=1 Tax=marine metagenome TaxID=408172 RepID=A0A382HAF8_9ZZZZ
MLCEKLCKYPKNFKLPFKARLNQVQFNSGPELLFLLLKALFSISAPLSPVSNSH